MTPDAAQLPVSDPFRLPDWALQRPAGAAQIAFQAGAVFAVLAPLLGDPGHGVPVALLANRMALRAAVATARLEGRVVRKEDMRDAYHLTPPGAPRGPDGDLVAFWRQSVDQQVPAPARIAGDPLTVSVAALRDILVADDRAERDACRAADIVLAKAVQWPRCLPVTAGAVTKTMLRDVAAGKAGADRALAVALLQAVQGVLVEARALRDRADAIRAVTPKLRARGAGAAVDVFLREDAVAPSTMLSPMVQGTTVRMSDRASRRLCDRLVSLGVANELTGRATFRLYGLAS